MHSGLNKASGAKDGEVRSGKLSKDIGLNDLRAIAQENDTGDIEDVEVSAIQNLKKDYKNVNAKLLLFDQSINDTDERFERLENAVQTIHDDFSDIKPGINRLIAIESDIKDLHRKLSQMIDGGGSSSSSRSQRSLKKQQGARKLSLKRDGGKIDAGSKPDPVDNNFLPSLNLVENTKPSPPAVKKQVQKTPTQRKKSPAVVRGGVDIVNMRVWESPNKTRVVLETPRKRDFVLDYDAGNQFITIETDQKFAADHLRKAESGSKQIVETSLSDTGTAGKAVLLMVVQNVKSVSKGYYLSPESSNLPHRYYFDIFK